MTDDHSPDWGKALDEAIDEVLAGIGDALAAAGLDGPEDADLRLALLGVVASPRTPPLQLRSETELDLELRLTAAGTLRRIARQCEETGQDYAEALRSIAEQARLLIVAQAWVPYQLGAGDYLDPMVN